MTEGSFQEAISPILVMGQLFAIMPVKNVRSKNPADLRFSWKSFRTFYAIFAFIILFIYSILTVYWSVFVGNIEFIRFVPVIFYCSNTYTILTFVMLARRWPELMKQWLKVESGLPKYATINEKRLLAHKIKIVSITIMTLSLSKNQLIQTFYLIYINYFYSAEHLLSIVTNLPISTKCNSQRDRVRDYFIVEYDQFFRFVEFTVFNAIIVKWINILGTFAWSFMDLFVMLIAIGLSTRFHQLNICLKKAKGKVIFFLYLYVTF